VKVRKALGPKQIASRVEDYDTVLSVEPSLADSINNHLDGEIAYTPRRLVEAEEDFQRKVFLSIVEETDFTWKQTSYLFDNILSCWKHTGEIENILEYSRFDAEEVREILEILEEKETPLDKISHFELDGEVAVVKEYQFDEMDRKILPEKYDSIDVFSETEEELSEFKIFSSASELVQSLAENISGLDPEKVGIVVKPGSKYEPLVKSMLEKEGIAYQRRENMQQDGDVRAFISVLETGLTQGTVRVEDVRPILQHAGINISYMHQNRKLEAISQGEELKDFLNAVKYLDFGDAVDEFHEIIGKKTDIPEIVRELNLESGQVTEARINVLRYYLDSFEIEKNEIDQGVMLADPTQVSYVDREHVFHLGMDTEWVRNLEEKPWIDQEKIEKRNLQDFKSLIQSGESYYLVQDEELNENIIPCFYFDEILDKKFTSFSDLPHSKVRSERSESGNGFETENYSVESSEMHAISQSGLNSFVQSPRLFFMDELISDADQQRLEKGNLFHMYAEYHASNPDTASEISREEIVDLMMDEIDEFADYLDREDLRTQFQVGVENIRGFLNSQEFEPVDLDQEYIQTEEDNVFVKEFPGNNSSPRTEAYFIDESIGVKGKVDLILDKNHLVDYKSGKRNSVRKVLKKSHVDHFEEERFPNFQPLLYITYHRQHVEGKIEFTFLHFLNEIGNSVRGEDSQIKTTITYHPETFQGKKASMEVFEEMIRDVAKSNDRRKTLEKLGFQHYRNFMEERDVPELFDKDELLRTEFAEEFENFAKQEVGDYKYVEKGVKKTLKKLVDFRMENYFKEDSDRMEEFLQDRIDEINEYLNSRFPVDVNPDELPQRELIVE